MPLAEVVLDSALLRGGALSEGSGATEGTSESAVLEADNADVASATGGTRAGHTLGHLDLDGEVGGSGSGETANTDTGDVLGDLGILECSGVGTARGGVDLGGERNELPLPHIPTRSTLRHSYARCTDMCVCVCVCVKVSPSLC